MSPRQSCNNLLHDFTLGKGFGERPYLFQGGGQTISDW